MKILTVGRGEDADIRIDDDMVSRRHASIKLLPLGKMEIRDLSKNGTFVNGVRIAPNKFHKVTRKDVVSFAKVRQLDWSEVPDLMRPYRIGAIAAGVCIVLALAVALVSRIDWGGKTEPATSEQTVEEYTPAIKDSDEPKAEEQPKASEESEADEKTDIPKGASFFPKKPQKDKDSKKDKKDAKDSGKKTEKTTAKEIRREHLPG